MMEIYSAPLQGATESVWRRAHAEIFGGIAAYFAPFVRVERGEVRRKDLREASPEANAGIDVVPQVLASAEAEMRIAIEALAALGYHHIDINLGCPFRPVTKRGHGAGILARPAEVEAMLAMLDSYRPTLRFSLKVRLGLDSPGELHALLPAIVAFRPELLAVHARTAAMQYAGEPLLDEMNTVMTAAADVPVVYNGDILTPADARRIAGRFPGLHGIMIGRGLLRRPSLAREINGGAPYTAAELRRLHELLYEHYEATLQGDSHLLATMKPLWEYAPAEIDRRRLKAIAKATTAARYRTAVADALAF